MGHLLARETHTLGYKRFGSSYGSYVYYCLRIVQQQYRNLNFLVEFRKQRNAVYSV